MKYDYQVTDRTLLLRLLDLLEVEELPFGVDEVWLVLRPELERAGIVAHRLAVAAPLRAKGDFARQRLAAFDPALDDERELREVFQERIVGGMVDEFRHVSDGD